MKLTKSGKIKACCRWSRQYNGELVSKGFSTERWKEFDIVSWEYSTSLKKMVWVERQARL